jgi:hypothetical protein
MPKRKCTFNEQLQKEYSYIKKGKTDHDVTCIHCGTNFSVAHGGRSDIKDHIQSDRHRQAAKGKASKGKKILCFLIIKLIV